MKISCIDFETANGARGSACSVGIAVFEDGKLQNSINYLLKPHRQVSYFDPFNISIHGIRSSDVAQAPEFDRLSGILFDLLKADLVVAHNAAFDISVLRSLCDLYQMRYPEFTYFCTCKAAKRFWPELDNFKLDTLCDFIGYEFMHHNSEADAGAAGAVLMRMLNESGTDSPFELAAKLRIRPGVLKPDSYLPCSVLKIK